MKTKLTEKVVAQLQAPDPSGRQKLYWDSELRGFGVLCSGVTNVRTYVTQRDLPDGRTRRVTIGAVSELTLDAARRAAADVLLELRRGNDPKRRVATPTLRATLEAYLAARKDLRPASIACHQEVRLYDR
jgi:hypothetical protein